MAIKKIIKTVWQIRRDTTENWLLNKDKIPAAGEPCYDLELKILKIGDGNTTYENLPAIGNIDIDALQAEVDSLKDLIESLQLDMDSFEEQVGGVNVPEAVEQLETDLKTYVDEQLETVVSKNFDDGEI